MDEAEFRAKYSTPNKSEVKLCIDCQLLPKQKPQHRCHWCLLKKAGTDAEVTAAYLRQRQPSEDEDPDSRFIYCQDCTSNVPFTHKGTFNSKTQICRGCKLIRDRDRRDAKIYGLESGERQVWYDAQDGRCFGCTNKQKVKGLALHHSHLTQEPLYLACLTCNKLVLGNAFDNPMTLLRLALGVFYPPHTPGNMERIEALIKEITDGTE